MKKSKKRIAIMTGGGDCAGLNAVIRAVTKKAIFEHHYEVFGIEDGYEGLVENKIRQLGTDDVSGILTQGGTILGTSNKTNPYAFASIRKGKLVFTDRSAEAIKNLKKLGVECLVCVGGDGTLKLASKLQQDGISIVGVPKTIDNDIRGTDITFGFDTAVSIATEGIDRVHTTAESHHRVLIVEVMGRTAGWIALHSGIAGGGDIILIPEIPYTMKNILTKVRDRSRCGKRYSIIVVAEGAKAKGGDVVIRKIVADSGEKVRLGGVGLFIGDQIEKMTGLESRTVVMGHLQRGGTPTPFDRILATRLGTQAMDMVSRKEYGYMVGIHCDTVVKVPLKDVAEGPRLISLQHSLIQSARSVGTCFGD